MSLSQHLDAFDGKPVEDWDPEAGSFDPAIVVYRVRLEYEDAEEGKHWTDLFSTLAAQPGVEAMTGLVVGQWASYARDAEHSADVVHAIIAARDRLPALRAIFLGDILSEENEISWIEQTDMAPLLAAYPRLETLGVRCGSGLGFRVTGHAHLKSLTIQSGGLSGAVVQDVLSADLPALEHLELWLGDPNYGGDAEAEDFALLLDGTRFPKLRRLGLRDSFIADDLAAMLARSPILERIRVLDLSLGALTDAGAQALLDSPAVARLEKLDLHHHFCSDEMVMRLKRLGIDVDVSDPQSPDDWDRFEGRYVSVAE